MRTTVRLPDDLMIAAKAKARKQGATLAKVIEDGVRAFVAGQTPAQAEKWTIPPMASAKGKMLIDIYDKDAMDQLDADEQLEKFR